MMRADEFSVEIAINDSPALSTFFEKWIEEARIKEFIDHRENDILEQYGKVLQYVQECGFYNDTALSIWSQITVADPWLIRG